MFNYEIGGNERKIDVNEAFGDISHNKTLFIQQLTDNDPIKPEKIAGLKTIEDVFGHFKPKVGFEFENADGSIKKETLKFSNLGDFSVKNILETNGSLKSLNDEKMISQNIIKQLKTNKSLKTALSDPESRAHFINAFKALIQELDNVDK